ncbi:GNAT family N-acetyltransferase [Billgrantia azerbaijanica]|nr:GNAT family N-acetyltransferase [Halomonas azerbaijanica]
MTEMRLRRLGESDLASLAALEAEQPHPWSAGQLREALRDPVACVFGGEVGEALVAHAVVARLPFEAELQALLVASAWRRRGAAVRLLAAVIEQARGWGSERLLLEGRADNVAALALYRRAGFVEDGRRPRYYPPLAPDGEREDAVLMSLALG